MSSLKEMPPQTSLAATEALLSVPGDANGHSPESQEETRPSVPPDPHTSTLSPQVLKNGAIVSTWWDAASGWQSGWFEVPGKGGTQPGSRITTVARDANHLDLFVIGTDGRVYSTYWNSTGGWSSGWFGLPGVTATQGAAITAIARTATNIDLFVTDVTGGCAWTHWSSSAGWASWTELGGSANPGSPITAVSRNTNSMDLFCVGKNDLVYSRSWNPSSAWTGWLPNPGPIVPPGSIIGTSVDSTSHITLYVTDTQGSIDSATSYSFPTTANQWAHVPGSVALKAGSPVTAVTRGSNHIDFFVTGADSRIYWTYWQTSANPAQMWLGEWLPLAGVFAPPGSTVTAVSRYPTHLDLFVTDISGMIRSTWWDQAVGWVNSGWFVVPGGSGAKPGSPITVISRNPNHLDLFVTG